MSNTNGSRSFWEKIKLLWENFKVIIILLAAVVTIPACLFTVYVLWRDVFPLSPPLFEVHYFYRPASQSEFKHLEEDNLLHSGDNYKIIFTVGQDNSYVYIFQSDSKNIDRLFPLQNFQGAKEQANPVHSGQQYFLPDEHQAFVLNHNTGQEKIYFLGFHEPDITLENLYSDYLQALQQQYTDQIAERQNNLLKRLQQGSPAGFPVLTFSHLN